LRRFSRPAAKKGDRALIDLRLFKSKIFSASVVTQFMANGIGVCRSDADSDLSDPCLWSVTQRDRLAAGSSWLGDDVLLPAAGNLDETLRHSQSVGWWRASGRLAGTLPFLYLASHGLVLGVLVSALLSEAWA